MQTQRKGAPFEKGVAVLSIDDGNFDDFRLYETVLSKKDLSATFNVTTGTVGEPLCITEEELRIMHRDPRIEIAAHGHRHQNDEEDILAGTDLLRRWLDLGSEPIGFASPGSRMKTPFIRENAEYLQSLGLLYARTAGNPEPYPWQLELRERLRAAGASEYAVKNAANLIRSFDDMCMHSVVVFHDTPLEDLYQMVELAAEEKACVVFLFHRTRKPGEADYDSPWSYDYDSFVEFAGYLAKRRDEGAILVQTAREAYLTSRSGGDQS